MKNFAKIILHPKKERSLKLFHPWVFSGAIARVEDNPAEGDNVEVYSSDNEFLGLGHFHEGSIKIRIFSFEKADPNENFWIEKIKSAFRLRERIGLIDNKHTNIYRLINGEADGLPGLIIDMYDKVAVIQTHTLGMHRIKDHLLAALKNVYDNRLETVYDKSTDTMGKSGTLNITNCFLFGDKTEKTLMENDILFNVNWAEGQKTGFFIDQRENRQLLENYSKGKTVLNTFSYSGGFSMYALKGGATLVHSVDSSKKACELSQQNAELNNFSSRHKVFSLDVFDFLKKGDEKYDIIILDPPAFAKHLSAVENAMVGYRNLNTEGIKRVQKGGLLFTFSCSQVIDRLLFRKLVFQASAQAKRNVRIIHQLSQGPDHPISLYHPEGEYLKGLVLIVD
jgi:23S rRNA (cytosine1962-C5)-methyltransferase